MNPSPVHPSLQVQVYDPTVSTQAALASQSFSCESKHSLASEIQNERQDYSQILAML